MPTTVVHKRYPHDVYIGRPSKWGNPFSHIKSVSACIYVPTREEAIANYEIWLRYHPELMAAIKTELKGKVLGCWCKPLPCHGDVLARIADTE